MNETHSDSRFRREFGRFYKFSIVGAFGALVDFGTFNILHTLIGMVAPLAQAFSFSIAVLSNFFWNRYWTYPDSRSKPMMRQASQFILVNLIGLGIRTPIFILTQPLLERLSQVALHWLPQFWEPTRIPFSHIEASVVGANLALATAIIVVLFWNFGVNRIWTYSDVV